jgi:hypothetical protein
VRFLTKSIIPGLKKAAELDLQTSDSKDAEQQLETATAWWDIGQKRRDEEQFAYLTRAADWYRKARPELSGLKKTQVESRLREFNKITTDRTMRPGLRKTIYFRYKTPFKIGSFPAQNELGAPVGPSVTIKSISPMTYDATQNMYTVGFLRIDKPGEYVFRSESFYERDLLTLNGKVLDRYGTRAHLATIRLEIGLIPIICAGSTGARGSVNVTWQPPGAKELTPIPSSVLFYKPGLAR